MQPGLAGGQGSQLCLGWRVGCALSRGGAVVV